MTIPIGFFAEFDAYYSGSRIPEGFRKTMDGALSPLKDLLLEQYIREGQEDGSIRNDLSDHLDSRKSWETGYGVFISG